MQMNFEQPQDPRMAYQTAYQTFPLLAFDYSKSHVHEQRKMKRSQSTMTRCFSN